MAVVSISLPDPLLASADRLVEKRGFSGRSEFVRACVRDFITANAEPDVPGPRSATVTLVYPEGCERQFTKLRHTFSDVIRTMLHGHAEGSCMEIFVLEGPGGRIREFTDCLRGTRDALQVGVVYADAWKHAKGGAPVAPAHDHPHGEEEKREAGRPRSSRGRR